MSGLLNERITALRKERGFTQEQLGQMVGVSAQAVSKWEKGGSPDVELLPAVADALGVTIDALFGREAGERIDPMDAVQRWVRTVPDGQRMDWLCRLVWEAANLAGGAKNMPKEEYSDQYFTDITEEDGTVHRYLRRTRVMTEDGFIVGARAKDMSFVTVWPEPEAGWKAFLADCDLYRRLFALLARPHCLEFLDYLLSRPNHLERNFTSGSVARQMGVEEEDVKALLESMAEMNLLLATELETEDGVIPTFCAFEVEGWVPFLSFAFWLMTGGSSTSLNRRKSPILRKETRKEKED